MFIWLLISIGHILPDKRRFSIAYLGFHSFMTEPEFLPEKDKGAFLPHCNRKLLYNLNLKITPNYCNVFSFLAAQYPSPFYIFTIHEHILDPTLL
jgi:hypothetical protein